MTCFYLSFIVTAQVSIPEVHGFGWERVQVGPSHGRRARVDGKLMLKV